jgi:hypothetical protein
MWSGGERPIPSHFTAWLVIATSLFVLPTAVFEAPGSFATSAHCATHGRRVVPLATSEDARPGLGEWRIGHRSPSQSLSSEDVS